MPVQETANKCIEQIKKQDNPNNSKCHEQNKKGPLILRALGTQKLLLVVK